MDRGRLCCGGADQRTHPPGETQMCHQSSFQPIPPAVHLVNDCKLPCNIFRCLTCTGTRESRPCSPPPRSTATSTSGISGGPARHQIVKQEDINRDPQKPAQSFQTIVGASHIRWSRGDCTYLARCSMSDKVTALYLAAKRRHS